MYSSLEDPLLVNFCIQSTSRPIRCYGTVHCRIESRLVQGKQYDQASQFSVILSMSDVSLNKIGDPLKK